MESDDSDIKYIRCQTCGRITPASQSINNLYCSTECTNEYAKCINCGKYFKPDKNENETKYYCSVECRTIYSKDGIILPDMKEE